MSELRSKLAGWLASAGLIVAPIEEKGLPSNAEWGLAVSTPPPIQVKLRLLGLRGGVVVAGIGVNFAEQHRQEMMKLKPAERIVFTARLTAALLTLCPYCRIALQGGMTEPSAIVAEIVYYSDTITKQRIVDDIARLINVFLLVNALLWQQFPQTHSGKGEGREGVSFL